MGAKINNEANEALTDAVKSNDVIGQSKDVVASVNNVLTYQSNINAIKRLKGSNDLILDSLMTHYATMYTDTKKEYSIKGVTGITGQQLATIVTGVLYGALTDEDKDAIKVLDVLTWFYTKKIHFNVNVEAVRNTETKLFKVMSDLKSTTGYYTTSALKAIHTKEGLTDSERVEALTKMINNAKAVKTAVQSLVKGDKAIRAITAPKKGFNISVSSVKYDIKQIDLTEIATYNRNVAIARLSV